MTLRDKEKAEKATQEYIRQSEKWLQRAVRVIQNAVYGHVVRELTGFAVGRDGSMSFTVANIRRAAAVALRIEGAVKPVSDGILRRIFRRFLLLFFHNRRYFADLTTQSIDDIARKRVLLSYGYDADKDEVISGGYLDAVLSSAPIRQIIARQINAAIMNRTPVNEFRKSFRQFFVNPAGTGYLDRHFLRFTHDLFMQVDRQIKNTYADQLGLEHFIYAGTAVDDTRPFCTARLNRTYTLDKADEWEDQDWQGKIPGVPVMQQLGGYNCRHTAMFISEEMAKMLEKQSGQPVNGFNAVLRKRKTRPT